jgi:hypothetical protein
MNRKKRVATIWSISGLLFALAGLGWTLNGNTAIGMMNIATGMSFIAISASKRKKGDEDDSKDEDSKSSED